MACSNTISSPNNAYDDVPKTIVPTTNSQTFYVQETFTGANDCFWGDSDLSFPTNNGTAQNIVPYGGDRLVPAGIDTARGKGLSNIVTHRNLNNVIITIAPDFAFSKYHGSFSGSRPDVRSANQTPATARSRWASLKLSRTQTTELRPPTGKIWQMTSPGSRGKTGALYVKSDQSAPARYHFIVASDTLFYVEEGTNVSLAYGSSFYSTAFYEQSTELTLTAYEQANAFFWADIGYDIT